MSGMQSMVSLCIRRDGVGVTLDDDMMVVQHAKTSGKQSSSSSLPRMGRDGRSSAHDMRVTTSIRISETQMRSGFRTLASRHRIVWRNVECLR